MKNRTTILLILIVSAVLVTGCRNPNLTGGILYIQQKNYDKAATTLSAAAKEDSLNAQVYYYWAVALGNTGQCVESGKSFDKALELDPAMKDSLSKERYYIWADHYNKGVQRYQAQLWDKAAEDFKCAMAIDASQAQTYINLGLTYIKMKQENEAESILKQGLGFAPDSPDLMLSLGDLYMTQAKFDEALPIYLKIANIRTEDANVYLRLGAIYDAKDDNQKALEAYEKCLSLDPDQEQVYSLLGVKYAEVGNDEKARQMFEKALEFDPDDPDLHFNLGVIYGRLKMVEDAERELKKADELDD